MKTFITLILCLLITPVSADAETEHDFGDYVVYFNVFNSDFLTPEVADQYHLTRSRNSAIINIAVQKKSPQGNIAVNAMLKGELRNIIGQLRPLEFLRVQEGRAIYYLGSFRVANSESLSFHINIRPDANAKGFDLNFTKQVFIE